MTESLLEVLRSEDLQTNAEAFLYCMGTIKFISGNPEFFNEMIDKGAVEILMNLIKEINDKTKENGTCLSNSDHLLVQVSTVLEKTRCMTQICLLSNNISCQPGGGYSRWSAPCIRCVLGVGESWGSKVTATATLCLVYV